MLGDGERYQSNPLFDELSSLIRRGLTTDTTLFRLTVVDASGLFCKTVPHIIGSGNDMLGDLHPSLVQRLLELRT